MKIFLVINLLFFLLECKAQNLIPNAGFEEKNIAPNLQWVQPQGEYYHYQEGTELSGLTHSGNYFNGICMYNYQENEYLSIQLKEPLKKGVKYCTSFYVRLYDGKKENYELTDKIGWYFSSKNIPSNNLINLEVKPQIIFTIIDTLDRTKWQFFQNNYEANGTETYLTVGYFNSLGVSEKYKQQQKDIFLGNYGNQSEEKKVPIEPEIGNKKKKIKNKDLENFRKQLNEQAKVQSPPQVISNTDIFSVRYYFDDFCLTPIENSCKCEEKKLEDLKIGESISLENILFETNSELLLNIAEADLNLVFDYLVSNSKVKLKINDHTDNEGNLDWNLKLSLKRAETVKNYLIAKGIDSTRLIAEGFGFTQPIDRNNSFEGKSKNRRVEFEVIAK